MVTAGSVLVAVTIATADEAAATAVAAAVASVTSNATAATLFLSDVPGLENVTVSEIREQPTVVSTATEDTEVRCPHCRVGQSRASSSEDQPG